MAHNQVEHNSNLKTLPSYMVGFAVSIILTLMAFGLVEWRVLTDNYLYVGISLLAIIQLIVQSMCFLRLNFNPEGRWNLLPFLFTILIITILASGSLWIMYNLNYNMMN